MGLTVSISDERFRAKHERSHMPSKAYGCGLAEVSPSTKTRRSHSSRFAIDPDMDPIKMMEPGRCVLAISRATAVAVMKQPLTLTFMTFWKSAIGYSRQSALMRIPAAATQT